MTPTVVWLYGVAGAGGAAWGGETAGIEGRPVRAIREGDLVAIVSDVPLAAYEQAALDESVRDGEWVTPRATAHQAACAAAHAALDALLPVPFGTIYRTDERVRDMLRARAAELVAKLASLRGRSEWVVGLYRDTVAAAGHLSRVDDAAARREAVAAGPGRRYLEERRSAGARRGELRRLDEEAATAARQALARVSATSFDEPVVDDAGDLVERTTYLVRRGDEHRFGDAVAGFNADWRERGYELRSTGPWPPYRSAA